MAESTQGKARSNSIADIFQISSRTARSPVRKRKEREEENMGEEVLIMLKDLMREVKEIKTGNNEMKEQIKEIRKDNAAMKREIKTMMEDTRKEIENLKQREAEWMKEKKQMNVRLQKLEQAEDNRERRQNKNKIIIKGVDFQKQNVKDEVKQFIKEQLEVEVDVKYVFLIGQQERKRIAIEKIAD